MVEGMFYISSFAILVSLGKVLLAPLKNWLIVEGMTAENYAGQWLPVGVGIVIPFLLWINAIIVAIWINWSGKALDSFSLVIIASITGVSFLGWLDDAHGESRIKGLLGHFKVLVRERRLTTGTMKAAGIGGISWFVAMQLEQDWPMVAFASLFLMLCTNGINLLDVRPGRAWKGTMMLILFLQLWVKSWGWTVVLLPFLASAVVLFLDDLKGRSMLGDTGSNTMGFIAGVWILHTVEPSVWMWLLPFWMLVHWYAEQKSINAWIERTKVMDILDQWGRS